LKCSPHFEQGNYSFLFITFMTLFQKSHHSKHHLVFCIPRIGVVFHCYYMKCSPIFGQEKYQFLFLLIRMLFSPFHHSKHHLCNAPRKIGLKFRQFCIILRILHMPPWDFCILWHCVGILRCKIFQTLLSSPLTLRISDCPATMLLPLCTS